MYGFAAWRAFSTRNLHWWVIASLSVSGSGCVGDVMIRLSEFPDLGRSPLAESFSTDVAVLEVKDARLAKGMIGDRRMLFDLSIGGVFLDGEVSDVVRELLIHVLHECGHRVVESGQVSLSARVLDFSVTTEATPLYWDIVGKVDIAVRATSEASSRELHSMYRSMSVERTYIWPGGGLIRSVLDQCIEDVGKQLARDQALADVISSRLEDWSGGGRP